MDLGCEKVKKRNIYGCRHAHKTEPGKTCSWRKDPDTGIRKGCGDGFLQG